jgi:Ca2+-binding EF-hand superfamily protein
MCDYKYFKNICNDLKPDKNVDQK